MIKIHRCFLLLISDYALSHFTYVSFAFLIYFHLGILCNLFDYYFRGLQPGPLAVAPLGYHQQLPMLRRMSRAEKQMEWKQLGA